MLRPRQIPEHLPTTFVDEESERFKASLLFAAVVAFLVSGWYSYKELRYLMGGQSVEAQVTRLYEFTVPTRRGPSGPRLGVEYRYTDTDGTSQDDKDWVKLPSPLQGAQTVHVQYLRGTDGGSRLLVNRSILGPMVFAGCVVFVVVNLIRFAQEANTPVRRSRRRQRR